MLRSGRSTTMLLRRTPSFALRRLRLVLPKCGADGGENINGTPFPASSLGTVSFFTRFSKASRNYFPPAVIFVPLSLYTFFGEIPRIRENRMNAIIKESESILYTISKWTDRFAKHVNNKTLTLNTLTNKPIFLMPSTYDGSIGTKKSRPMFVKAGFNGSIRDYGKFAISGGMGRAR